MTEVLLAIVAIAILGCWVYDRHRTDKSFVAERQAWDQERKQLLDRIQAPSFGEMKHAEVKIIKAQQGHKEPPQLEPL